MRLESDLLKLLRCKACHAALELHTDEPPAEDGHVMTGSLTCTVCNAVYPIQGGIPRFVPSTLDNDVLATTDGFGYEWDSAARYIWDTQFTSPDLFLDFIYPVEPAYFQHRVVLDAGCGTGRFSRLAQNFGAETVVGVDLSRAVDVAFQNLRAYPNIVIIQADLFELPLRSDFDYAFSIGVLHHTASPREAFHRMAELVKPGGGVSAWVYGRENNDWIIYLLNPIRRVLTSRLPRPVLRALAYILAVPLFLILKTIYRPIGRYKWLAGLQKWLFYFDYLFYLSQFDFHTQAWIIFDHLVPTIAEYIPQAEFQDWYESDGLLDVTITSRAGTS